MNPSHLGLLELQSPSPQLSESDVLFGSPRLDCSLNTIHSPHNKLEPSPVSHYCFPFSGASHPRKSVSQRPSCSVPHILSGFLVAYSGRMISMTAILCGQTYKFLIVSFTFASLGPRHWPFLWELLAWVPTPCGVAVNLDPTGMQCWLQEPINFVFLPRTTARQMVSFSRASSPCQLVIFFTVPIYLFFYYPCFFD